MRWYPSRTMVAANGALDADKKKYSRPCGNRIKISAHAQRLALANARALHTISLPAGIKSNGILCLSRRYQGRKAIKLVESSDRAIGFMLSPEVRIALHVYWKFARLFILNSSGTPECSADVIPLRADAGWLRRQNPRCNLKPVEGSGKSPNSYQYWNCQEIWPHRVIIISDVSLFVPLRSDV